MSPSPTLHGKTIPAYSGTSKQLIIMLHGLGANGDDLMGLAPVVAPALPNAAFAAPDAPFPCDMAPMGYQWFSLQSREETYMLDGIIKAAPILNRYIDEQLAALGIADDQLALAGFSQGTMMALYTALRRPKPIAGIVGFSGMLVAPQLLAAEKRSAPPVCLIHGKADMVVPFAAMSHAELALRNAGIDVEAHPREGLAHSIDPQGLEAAIAFLTRVLNRTS